MLQVCRHSGSCLATVRYLTRQGRWAKDRNKRALFSTQNAADTFTRKHVRGEDWGVFGRGDR